MSYRLKTERLRLVGRDDKGRVTSRKRFKRGDAVKKSDFPEEHRFDQLLDSGALVTEAEWEKMQAGTPYTVDVLSDEERETLLARIKELEENAQASDDDDADADADGADDDKSDQPEDFESFDYPTLQALAKERTGNGSGGRQDLIDRLTAHAASA